MKSILNRCSVYENNGTYNTLHETNEACALASSPGVPGSLWCEANFRVLLRNSDGNPNYLHEIIEACELTTSPGVPGNFWDETKFSECK